ncbi:beta-glucanase [Kitasatospora sp. MAA4]|uniref:beta-glucanase n=1 Tax=Kitasatospora sp. MAA4 TaxID=3035093 RepID=UPI0024765C1C|nr:beta-glucanase [Kitasatospora sp. MAA4]
MPSALPAEAGHALARRGDARPAPNTPGAADVVLNETFQHLDLGPQGAWGWQSTAFAHCLDNPGNGKLDHLVPTAASSKQGYLTITATARPDGRWNTGLLTTGDSCDSGGSGVQVRTGDLLLAHVRLPAADSGAWPALWTWRDGQNEADIFEWHSDHPNTLEFVNHVRHGDSTYTGPDVAAGAWLYVGARFGADNITWYIGSDADHLTAAYADHVGVGSDFAAYPILNLSIDNGANHPAPTTTTPVTLACDQLLIQHPAPPDLPDQ